MYRFSFRRRPGWGGGIVLLLLFLGLAGNPLRADWAEQRQEAERWRAEGSFARAEALYAAAPTNLPPAEARWARFRQFDCRWRAQADNLRSEPAEQALKALQEAFAQDAPTPDRDRVWAEAQESLGDFHDRRQDERDWVQTRYGRALDWWAGQTDLGQARPRYLALVWKLARHPQPGDEGHGYFQPVPLEWLNGAVEIAREPADQAQARFLRALALRQLGPPDERALYLVEDDFQAALAAGRGTPWYDDALYHYAEWLEQSGRLVLPPSGGWLRQGDAARALERFEQLTTEFEEGKSRYWRLARDRARQIRAVELGLSVGGCFLPGSEVVAEARWRNVVRFTVALHPVDLTRAVRGIDRRRGASDWLGAVDLSESRPVANWVVETGDGGRPEPGSRTLVFTNRPAMGAYVLELQAGDQRARDLVLVTDATLSLRTAGKDVLAWFTDALTGQPIPEASIRLWRGVLGPGAGGRREVRWEAADRSADADGVARFEAGPVTGEILVFARHGDRQALARSWTTPGPAAPDDWKLYVATDRPAYRPAETVQWKLTARRRERGEYRVDPGAALSLDIVDPRGATLTNGVARLNDFGTAWGSFGLGPEPVLGVYQIRFWRDPERRQSVGQAPLFRLEEYRLPEFEVKVAGPDEPAPGGGRRPRGFKLGEAIEVAVQADYYTGGPVADAAVELVVHRRPWQIAWPTPREYPWLHAPAGMPDFPGRPGFVPDQVVRRESLRTDAAGRAVITLETEAAGPDVEFRVEARVVDGSRREVTGQGTLRATRQRYFVHGRPRRLLPQPGEKVEVEFRARDANDQPVAVPGTVALTRETWREVWLDPEGREVSGRELDEARRRAPSWPPPPGPDGRVWRLKSRGYDRLELGTHAVRADTNGLGVFTFTPDREGFYRVAWMSPGNFTAPPPPDNRPRPYEPEVTAEATVWACAGNSLDVGYRGGGLELIVDRETFRDGQVAPVMVVADEPGRWVLLTEETGGALSHQVVALAGNVKRVELPITARHVPNFFLAGLLVKSRRVLQDQKEILVPPARQYLAVEVAPEAAELKPGDTGTLAVTVRDADGRPVAAEVSLGVADDSVYAIQPELAGDPRPFFFGEKRSSQGSFSSTLNERPYRRLVRSTRDGFHDDRSGPPGAAESAAAEAGMAGGLALGDSPVLGSRFGLRAKGGRADLPMAMADAAPAMGEALARGARPVAAVADAGGAAAGVPEPAVVVRSDFRATAFWKPDVVTGADGTARVRLTYPDTLTRWRATARAVSRETQVGWASTHARTRLPLRVRLQSPRFLVAGDVAVVSSVIMNQTDQPLAVESRLVAEGVEVLGGWVNGAPAKVKKAPTVTIPARGEVREDWAVRAGRPGPVRLQVSARGGGLADAMERSIEALEHGLEQVVAATAQARSGDAALTLVLPEGRRPGSTRVALQATPALGLTLLDALPYLAEDAEGCTEQTLGRFVPAVTVRKTLKELGLDPGETLGRAGTNGVAPRRGAGPAGPAARRDPVKLDAVIQAGLARLRDFQRADGSWGWWKEGDSDPWMTAYALWALTLASDAGVGVGLPNLSGAADWLRRRLVEAESQPNLQAWELHALAAWRSSIRERQPDPVEEAALQNAYARRDRLSSYGRSLLALACQTLGRTNEAATLVRNLENGVIRGDTAGSVLAPAAGQAPGETTALAHWGGTGPDRWRWSEAPIETTAFALRALLAVQPSHSLVEPARNWLVRSRRGPRWSNTRDTALVVLALNDLLRVSGEARPDLSFTVEVNGREVGSADLAGRSLAEVPTTFLIDGEGLSSTNQIRVRRRGGTSPLYLSAEARFFTVAEPVPAAGNELFVRREYFRLVPRPTLLKGFIPEREPLKDGEPLRSGDRVEVVVTVETKHDAEYLVLEDLKPAGVEAVELRSGGWITARQLRPDRVAGPSASRPPEDYAGLARQVYPEWRDRQVTLFADRLETGFWELRLELRAETPGEFHALPVTVEAMYAPDLRANSAETRIRVRE